MMMRAGLAQVVGVSKSNKKKQNWAANVILHPDVVPSRGKFTGDFV